MARALVEFAPRRRQLTVDEDTGNKNQKGTTNTAAASKTVDGRPVDGGRVIEYTIHANRRVVGAFFFNPSLRSRSVSYNLF